MNRRSRVDRGLTRVCSSVEAGGHWNSWKGTRSDQPVEAIYQVPDEAPHPPGSSTRLTGAVIESTSTDENWMRGG